MNDYNLKIDLEIEKLFSEAVRKYAADIGSYSINNGPKEESLKYLEARSVSARLML